MPEETKKTRKGPNQKQKMLYLAKILSEETDDRHSLTIQDLISKLAASGINADRKTLYQDLEELRSFGMDIITTHTGHNYYYSLGSTNEKTCHNLFSFRQANCISHDCIIFAFRRSTTPAGG